MHRTYVHDDGKVHEYFFGPMEATKSERWVTLTLPGNEGCVVALHLARTKEDQALLGKQGGSHPYFAIETQDCLGDYKRMKKLGVKFHGEPEVRPYGTGVILEDPYGNKIFMNQEPADAAK
jgi:Glyoxalase/Bleomycin resistance protein/Dioxygenase superfamily